MRQWKVGARTTKTGPVLRRIASSVLGFGEDMVGDATELKDQALALKEPRFHQGCCGVT